MSLQRYRDEIDIESLKNFNPLAAPGAVLKKSVEGNVVLMPAKQTLYCSGVGKGMSSMMQYSQPDTYNAICNLARHMTVAMQGHFDAMLRMMKYVDNTGDRGLTQNQMQKWNRSKDHEFIISSQSDSNYMQKIHRCNRAPLDTGYYRKVHQ